VAGGCGLWLCSLAAVLVFANPEAAHADPVQTAEVQQLLAREPMTPENWPAWRERLLSWLGDPGDGSEPAFDAASKMLVQQAGPAAKVPPPLDQDSLAWYLLANALLNSGEAGMHAVVQAEAACRQAIALDPTFARAHRQLGVTLELQNKPGFDAAYDEARRLDPELSLASARGSVALKQNRLPQAAQWFQQAMADAPGSVRIARLAAMTAMQGPAPSKAQQISPILAKFPNDGALICMHGLACAADGDFPKAQAELDRARAAGFDPSTLVPEHLLKRIADGAAPSLLVRFLYAMLAFVAVYAIVIVGMAFTGWILAFWTRGSGALDLLGHASEMVEEGRVRRVSGESMLARFYGLSLFCGLVLFYIAVPFIVAGLLAATLGLLWLIFQANRIPIKLVLIIVVCGLGMVWAVLKSLFVQLGHEPFGLQQTEEESPRLFGLAREVADRVDTRPIDDIYIAPGSGIGVFQQGRGPFGIFGVKRRILTLGLSTMHFLTMDELKSILAHEYAHFSHSDTFYSRFIHQVTLSIEQALQGIGATIGRLNYINPFYWFLYLYYRAYSLLASGFSRSREFLADRMACVLYGSDVFASALSKVAIEGDLFESTAYSNVAHLLSQDQAYVNIYQTFREFREEHLASTNRDEAFQQLLEERGSLFASHPTFRERLEAAARLPKAERPNSTAASDLFPNLEELEQELTKLLTAYVHHLNQLQAQAQAQG
jgi:Zn-dependent protease with chaperone function